MVAQSSHAVNTVPGRSLTDPDWLRARIAEMGRSWGTGEARVAGTLWWCMVASALVQPLASACVESTPPPCPDLDGFDCEVRPDGGVERLRFLPSDPNADLPSAAAALRATLAEIIPRVAAVSGAGPAALWAVVADAVGNRAIDAGDPAVGTLLAAQVGAQLPAPRFVEVGGRTFVRRISCCLVYEVPGSDLCTSCPKRPAAERTALWERRAADS